MGIPIPDKLGKALKRTEVCQPSEPKEGTASSGFGRESNCKAIIICLLLLLLAVIGITFILRTHYHAPPGTKFRGQKQEEVSVNCLAAESLEHCWMTLLLCMSARSVWGLANFVWGLASS